MVTLVVDGLESSAARRVPYWPPVMAGSRSGQRQYRPRLPLNRSLVTHEVTIQGGENEHRLPQHLLCAAIAIVSRWILGGGSALIFFRGPPQELTFA
jgi:hypothetical protein